jgi:hypothetical protein
MLLARFLSFAQDVISRFQVTHFLTAEGHSLLPIARGEDHRIASLQASLLRAFLEGLRELRYKTSLASGGGVRQDGLKRSANGTQFVRLKPRADLSTSSDLFSFAKNVGNNSG